MLSMKTLFSQSALSRKSYAPLLYSYSLIYSLIRERRKPSRKQIRAIVDGGYFATKGTFKNKGLIGNHYMIFIFHS